METGQLSDVTEEGSSIPDTGMIVFCATIITAASYTMGIGSIRGQNMKLNIPTANPWLSD